MGQVVERDMQTWSKLLFCSNRMLTTLGQCCDELLVKFLENFSDVTNGLLMQQSQIVFMKYVCVGVFKTSDSF